LVIQVLAKPVSLPFHAGNTGQIQLGRLVFGIEVKGFNGRIFEELMMKFNRGYTLP